MVAAPKSILLLFITSVMVLLGCGPKERSDYPNDEIDRQLTAFQLQYGETEIAIDSIFSRHVIITKVDLPEHLECDIDTNFGVLCFSLTGDAWPPISIAQIRTERGIYDIALEGPTDLQQVFMLQDEGFGQVYVVGTFTDWKKQEMFPTHGGQWVLELKLEPERYLYHFLADGKALRDPSNPEFYDDGYPEYSVLDLRTDQSSKARVVETDTSIQTHCATCISVYYLSDNEVLACNELNDSIWELDKRSIRAKMDSTSLMIYANGKFRSTGIHYELSKEHSSPAQSTQHNS